MPPSCEGLEVRLTTLPLNPLSRRLRLALLLLCATPAMAAPSALVKRTSFGPSPSRPAVTAAAPRADFGRERPSRDVYAMANWIVASDDHHGAAFVLVDKIQAKAYVFDPRGHLRGAAPVLLGLAKGDDTVPGIGERKLADIKPEERTTPAGRFLAEIGRNARGEDIVWVDYDAAVSMHRVLTSNPAEHRLQRLATRTPKDNRISYGCINMPVAFFEKVLEPTVASGQTIIYILPETRSLSAVFGMRDTTRKRMLPATLAKPEPTLQLRQLEGA